MNTTHDVTLPPAQADELAELLEILVGWLTAGDQRALTDLETHLDYQALIHGGILEHLDATEQFLPQFTTLIAAYQALLDRPDLDEGDNW